MYDPMTVAFDLKYPWYEYKPWPPHIREWERMTPELQLGRSQYFRKGTRKTFITIWHVDPELNGSDDSCGFSYPRLTAEQIESLKVLAWNEANYPYYLKRNGRKWMGTRHEAECLYRGLMINVADRLKVRMTFEEVAKYASHVIHLSTSSDVADIFVYEPGFHSNFQEDHKEERERYFLGVICGIARNILGSRRPWYKHPKWHIKHWKIQCHPIQQFKRWAFSRCCKCGKRFKYGYAPCTGSWYGTGPLWFRSEKYVYHAECDNSGVGVAAAKEKR